MQRKYYYDACEHCSELEHCDIANVTNEEQPQVWSCDEFHWDESKLQSPDNHATQELGSESEGSEGSGNGLSRAMNEREL